MQNKANPPSTANSTTSIHCTSVPLFPLFSGACQNRSGSVSSLHVTFALTELPVMQQGKLINRYLQSKARPIVPFFFNCLRALVVVKPVAYPGFTASRCFMSPLYFFSNVLLIKSNTRCFAVLLIAILSFLRTPISAQSPNTATMIVTLADQSGNTSARRLSLPK